MCWVRHICIISEQMVVLIVFIREIVLVSDVRDTAKYINCCTNANKYLIKYFIF